jgi:hypothetical protein
MLLKTNEDRTDILTNATMLMKTTDLHSLTHDVYEKKGTWLKPQVENRDGGVRPRPLWFYPLGHFNDPAEG